MAPIGHELQHAIEILSDPQVTDGVGAYFLFDASSPRLDLGPRQRSKQRRRSAPASTSAAKRAMPRVDRRRSGWLAEPKLTLRHS